MFKLLELESGLKTEAVLNRVTFAQPKIEGHWQSNANNFVTEFIQWEKITNQNGCSIVLSLSRKLNCQNFAFWLLTFSVPDDEQQCCHLALSPQQLQRWKIVKSLTICAPVWSCLESSWPQKCFKKKHKSQFFLCMIAAHKTIARFLH